MGTIIPNLYPGISPTPPHRLPPVVSAHQHRIAASSDKGEPLRIAVDGLGRFDIDIDISGHAIHRETDGETSVELPGPGLSTRLIKQQR